ncbi:MAG: hypothetical protein V4534_02665 [Myxococcota bacterium]
MKSVLVSLFCFFLQSAHALAHTNQKLSSNRIDSQALNAIGQYSAFLFCVVGAFAFMKRALERNKAIKTISRTSVLNRVESFPDLFSREDLTLPNPRELMRFTPPPEPDIP